MKIVSNYSLRILLISLIMTFFPLNSLVSREIDSLALIISSINESSIEMLIEKSKYLEIEVGKTREELTKNLFSYYGYNPIEATQIQLPLVKINSSDYFYINDNKNQILLQGNVSIDFSKNTLIADTILYDDVSNYMYAIGNVTLVQIKNEKEETILGNYLVYNINSGEITMNRGETRSVYIDSQENETQFRSKGDFIELSNDPFALSVSKSSVTTSQESEYYQIKSSSLHVVEGNDLFLSNTSLYLGRVPILYLPFFFYPGKTIIFNPSFGYDSIKGTFVNTTYELFGNNPLIHESKETGITSFIGNSSTLEKSSSMLYSSGEQENLSSIEKWAKETSSFGSLYLDAYQNNGLFLGYEGKNNFLEDSFHANLLAGLAYHTPSNLTNGSLFRYIFTPELTYKKNKTSLSLSIPVYSDPDIKKDYLNRDIRTRLLELANINTKEETNTTSISSYTWNFKGSTSFSFDPLKPYIEDIKLNRLNSSVTFDEHYDASIGGYMIDSMTLIDTSITITGELLHVKKTSSFVSTQEPFFTDLQNNLLQKYNLSIAKEPNTQNNDVTRSSSLIIKYSMKQDFKEVLDYNRGLQVDTISTNNNTSSISLSSVIGPQFITFDHSIRSLFTYDSTSTKESKQYELWSDNTITIPFLSLHYTFDQRLYRNSIQTDESTTQILKGFTDFSSDYVKTHSISFLPSYSIGDILITPSLVLQLPPLVQTITPRLNMKYMKFSTSFSFDVKEDDNANLDIFKGFFLVSYTSDNVILMNNVSYTKSNLDLPFLQSIINTSSVTISLFDSNFIMNGKTIFDTSISTFTLLKGSISLPFIAVNFEGSVENQNIIGESLNISLINSLDKKLWWKDRVSLSYDINAMYHHSFIDSFSSYASMDLSFTFEIYKFLSIKGSVSSRNKGLYQYANLGEAITDLLQSFDFFGTGRTTTQFIMDSVSLGIIHYMDDWDLYLTYSAKMESINNRYEWTPTLQILVKWKAISDIKVDREVKL